MDGYTNAEERALEVVRQLDRFIREGRTPGKGMNYNQWQELALMEITNAVRDAEKTVRVREHHNLRLVFTVVSCLTTIGFWRVDGECCLGAFCLCYLDGYWSDFADYRGRQARASADIEI